MLVAKNTQLRNLVDENLIEKNKAQAGEKMREKAGLPARLFKREPCGRCHPTASLGQTRWNRESCGPAATLPCLHRVLSDSEARASEIAVSK